MKMSANEEQLEEVQNEEQLEEIQPTEKRRRLIEFEWYKEWSVHLGYICGILTVIGLVYGIVSYHQTVKPLVDEKKLKTEIEELEVQNSDLIGENLLLGETKDDLNKELSDLVTKRDHLEGELQNKEEQLDKLAEEVNIANADAFMTPIIYSFLLSSVYPSEYKVNIKEETLKELAELSENTSLTNSQENTLNSLINFVNEEISPDSTYNDLLRYRIYFFEQNLK